MQRLGANSIYKKTEWRRQQEWEELHWVTGGAIADRDWAANCCAKTVTTGHVRNRVPHFPDLIGRRNKLARSFVMTTLLFVYKGRNNRGCRDKMVDG